MTETEYAKPLPTITRQTKPFWDAAKRHELLVQRCADCNRYHLPGADLCPMCGGQLAWVPASGKGKVHTFTIMYMAYNKAWKDDIPYNVSVIELEEGPLLMSNIVNCPNAEIKTGMAVKVLFQDVTPEETLHRFEPA